MLVGLPINAVDIKADQSRSLIYEIVKNKPDLNLMKSLIAAGADVNFSGKDLNGWSGSLMTWARFRCGLGSRYPLFI